MQTPSALALLVLALALALGGCGRGHGRHWTLPEQQQARINAVFSGFNTHTPGCVVGVVQNGRLSYAHGYGMANLDDATPLTPDSVLEIGSVSKQFTAASIFLLAHAGKLSLDDPVQKYIPELPRYRQPVTIRELLHHTSGIRDVIQLMEVSGIPYDDYASQADALALIERQKELNFPPNTRYLYSNSGYVLLGEIVRRVSGQRLADFAAQHIFQPLGMNHTQILYQHNKVVPGRAASYEPAPDGGYRINLSSWEQTGDGAVNTTVGDLSKWASNFLHPSVGGPWLIADLETRGVLSDGQPIRYAGGLEVDTYRGLRRLSHIGSWQGYRARFAMYPSQKLALIDLCNVTNANVARMQTVADILLQGHLKPAAAVPPPAPLPGDQLQPLAGPYWSATAHDLRRVVYRDQKLYLRGQQEPSGELIPIAGPAFALGDARAQFQQDGGHEQMTLASRPAMQMQSRTETLVRTPPPPLHAAQRQRLIGSYDSRELQVRWKITAGDHGLQLDAYGANPNRLDTDHTYPLQPVAPGVFSAGPYVLEFGSTGFRLDTGGANGILFQPMGSRHLHSGHSPPQAAGGLGAPEAGARRLQTGAPGALARRGGRNSEGASLAVERERGPRQSTASHQAAHP